MFMSRFFGKLYKALYEKDVQFNENINYRRWKT